METTATEAARNFSRLLDDVEHARATYTVTRGGRTVAVIGPPGPRSMTVGELVERLRSAPRPDDAYADDLDWARRSLPPLPDDPWAS